MRFGILGALTVWTDAGDPVAIPGAKVRALLADLLVHANEPVSADRLIDDIWGDRPPGNAAGTLSAKASQLRRALADAEPGAKSLVVSPPPGYVLRVSPDALDAHRFTQLTARARAATDPADAVSLFTDALQLWRGDALADFTDDEFAGPTIARLAEQRVVAAEDLAFARLRLGRHAEVVADVADLLVKHPLRERLRIAHMRALYGAGRQHDALASFEDGRTLLADELGLDPGAELVALQRSILAQDETLAVAARSMIHVKRRHTNLPADLTDLVGRDDDLDDLRHALGRDRLVTLTGPGGVGKTRLALAVAAGVKDNYDDGVWLVELAGLVRPTAADIADAVAAALDVRDTGDIGDPVQRIGSAVHERSMLLVLDNCEHVLDEVAEIAAALLRAAPALTVLSTSRESLGIPGELVWPVDTLPPADAIALFVARARASSRAFTLDDDTRAAVALLCRRLDGIPLALELAATRVRALGVHEMVERLDDRFRLLATGYRGRPPRQQTLQAMIDWSWDLLGDPEKAVLRRLAVHADGCTLAAAAAVCAGSTVDSDNVADLLLRLVDRSLVDVTHVRGDSRYRLLESVAAYCVQRLCDADEFAESRGRHLAYYLALAERAAPELRGPRQQRWLGVLDAESANLRIALATAVGVGDAESALRLANSLGWYWFLRGRLGEARRALGAALGVPAEAVANLRGIARSWDAGFACRQGESVRVEVLDDIADPLERAYARWFLAFTGFDSFSSLVADLETALPVFESRADRWGIAAVHLVKATAAHITSDLGELERCANLSSAHFTAVGDRWGRLQADEWLGALAELRGDLTEAARRHRSGLRIAEELELWQDVGGHQSWLGWIAMEQGEYATAIEYCESALKLAVEQGSIAGHVFASMGLGFAARRAGDHARAREVLQAIADLPMSDAAEPPPYLPTILCELGFLAELSGDADAARETHSRAYDVALAMAAPRDAAYALEGMAGALAISGSAERGAALLGAAGMVQERSGLPASPSEVGDVARITALLEAALGADRLQENVNAGRALTPDELADLVSAVR